MPWKNGGGETREVVVWPADASLDALDWRISLATVASDGPFSMFAGVTRTLCVIQGAGIELRVNDTPAHVLQTSSEPCTFDGEAPASASLIRGPIVDLNVMSRRGRFRHHVRRQAFTGSRELWVTAAATIIFCLEGSLLCTAADGSGELKREDCALIERAPQAVKVSAARRAEALIIELYREPTRSGT
jgi:uncharacterized protein